MSANVAKKSKTRTKAYGYAMKKKLIANIFFAVVAIKIVMIKVHFLRHCTFVMKDISLSLKRLRGCLSMTFIGLLISARVVSRIDG